MEGDKGGATGRMQQQLASCLHSFFSLLLGGRIPLNPAGLLSESGQA